VQVHVKEHVDTDQTDLIAPISADIITGVLANRVTNTIAVRAPVHLPAAALYISSSDP
jgi:hypothetical protein